MPSEENSILFLAAHSGIGKVAFFEELDKLKLEDEIIINYQNNLYKYRIKNIWEEPKNGYIHINKTQKKELILTTCSPKKEKKQLVIQSTLST